MEPPVSPLVLTKLRVPSARPRMVLRERLLERMQADRFPGLILVCAPAGYGKTTLLADWAQALQKTGGAVAWYALDPSDDDPIPFGSYLIASFIQALGPLPELAQLARLLRSSPEMDLQKILPGVINAAAASGREYVLVLDDYHLVSAPAIHSAVAYLLEHLPENMRVAVGSRSDPPLPLARLRARGQMIEIRAGSLRFTADETTQFLNKVMRLDLTPAGVAALEERTEGWVAGLQLAALSLSGRADKELLIASFSGSHRYLVEYLLEEVVSRQPAEVQSFLLSTSILERMCAPLCSAMLGEGMPSEMILEQLEQANLFVVALDDAGSSAAGDSGGGWFRYHHLFRDFLRARLLKGPPEHITALHRSACEWLAAHELLREAAGHAFQAQDWEYAADFAEKHCFTLMVHSDLATIYAWCSAFPEEVMQRHPMLCIHQCWALVFAFRQQNRSRVEARLRQVEQAMAVIVQKEQARELGETVSIIRTLMAMNPDPAVDPREQLAQAQTMLGYYPNKDPGQFTGLLMTGYAQMALCNAPAAAQALEQSREVALEARLYFGVAESTFHLARLAHSQGQLRRAAQICRQGQADIAALLARPEQELPAVGCLDIARGCVLLEQDVLDEAETRLLRGLELVGWGTNPYYRLTAHVALFRLYEIRGNLVEAIHNLDTLEATWPDIAFCTRGLRAMHALRAAPEDPEVLAEVTDWCKTSAALLGEQVPAPGLGPFGGAEIYYLASLAWMRGLIATGDAPGSTQAAGIPLERQLSLARENGLGYRVIELTLLDAERKTRRGENDQALTCLEQALALAQPEGYLRIFDQGPWLTHLLRQARRRGIYRAYAARILAAIGGEDTAEPDLSEDAARAPAHPLPSAELEYTEALSERELDVLRLIAQGATNQAIAERLVITVGTVKSHINHILGKLAAQNRTEAVARARELGLLA